MKRLFLILLVLLLLSGTGVVAWTVAGLPPVGMVWNYGFSFHPEPTGEVMPCEGITFVAIGPGCYRMGSEQDVWGGDRFGRWCARFGLPWGEHPEPSDEMPVHWVEFPRGFWMAKTEVTNTQYEAFDPAHPRSEYSPGDNDPVVDVSWDEAQMYCTWLGKLSGQAVRLPSESEWECACRAGSDREYCYGDDEGRLGEYAWYEANSKGAAHEVGTRRANAWGLFDLHGNVSEWCEDAWHDSYENAPAEGTAWTEGGEVYLGTPYLVYRGGGWGFPAGRCRSANRARITPVFWSSSLGFRPAFRPSGN